MAGTNGIKRDLGASGRFERSSEKPFVPASRGGGLLGLDLTGRVFVLRGLFSDDLFEGAAEHEAEHL